MSFYFSRTSSPSHKNLYRQGESPIDILLTNRYSLNLSKLSIIRDCFESLKDGFELVSGFDGACCVMVVAPRKLMVSLYFYGKKGEI